MALDQDDFAHLLELRTGLRRFLRWSEGQAKAAGLTGAKHQLLLAIKGHPDPAGPTVGRAGSSAAVLPTRAVCAGATSRFGRDPRPEPPR